MVGRKGCDPMTEISLILIDDDDVGRFGIKKILEQYDDITIAGEAKNGESGLTLIEKEKPDVALVDFNMPGLHGLTLIQKIKAINPTIKIITITIENNPYLLSRAIEAGSESILLKSDTNKGANFIEVIRDILKKKYHLPKGDAYSINKATLERNAFTIALNKTELQAVATLANQESKGNSIEEIAVVLGKKLGSIRNTLRSARKKLNVKNNNELNQLYKKLFPE